MNPNSINIMHVYLTSAERNMGEHATINKGLIANLGQFGEGRTFNDRMSDPDYRRKHSGGKWIPIEVWDIPENIVKQHPNVDDEVRRILIEDNLGIVESTNTHNTEELIFHTDTGDGLIAEALVKKAIEKVIEGFAFPMRSPFKARAYQKQDIQNVIDVLHNFKHALLKAFPGWGKSTCVPRFFDLLANITSCGSTSTGYSFLYTTPITDSLDNINNALRTIQYGNSEFHVIMMDDITKDTDTLIQDKLANGIHVVILLSVQGLRHNDNGSRYTRQGKIDQKVRKKLSFLYKIKILMWIRDEFHKDYNGHVTKTVFKGITAKCFLDMTATPYNLIENSEYTKKQLVGDTFLNVAKKKKDGIEYYQQFPNVHMETWETILTEDSELRNLYSGHEEWDPRKLLDMKNDELTHTSIIQDINKQAYGYYRTKDGSYRVGISKDKNPMSILEDPQLSKISKCMGMHIMAEGDSEYDVNVRCDEYVKVLNNDSTQRMEYITAKKIKKEAKQRGVSVSQVAKKHLKKVQADGKAGLIIVTHRMLVTGTDIDSLGHIVLFDKIGSLNDFVQATLRVFREYSDKRDVKIYAACPGMDVCVKVYEAMKAEAKEYGNGDPREFYDLIPIAEYVRDDGRFYSKQISYDDLMDRFNKHQDRILSGDWFSKNFFNKFHELDDLVKGIDDFDPLKGAGIDPYEITKKTGAKVKKPTNRSPIKNDNKDRKIGKDWKETIAVMLNESIRIGYSNDCKNIRKVFNTESAEYEFGKNNVGLIHVLFANNEFLQAVDYKYCQRIAEVKDLGYENTFFKKLYNNKPYKAKLGLVYVEPDLAVEIVNKTYDLLTHDAYDLALINNKECVIIIINALSGTLAQATREKNPNARIICVEYFSFEIKHLNKMGFETVDIKQDVNNFSIEYMNSKLQKKINKNGIDLILGNPPYQDPTNPGVKLFRDFLTNAVSRFDSKPIIGFVTPNTWLSWNDKEFSTVTDRYNISFLDTRSQYLKDVYFPDVGSTFCWFILTSKDDNNDITTTLVTYDDEFQYDINTIGFIPVENTASKVCIQPTPLVLSIIKKYFDYQGDCIEGSFVTTGGVGTRTKHNKKISETHQYPCYCSTVEDKNLDFIEIKTKHHDAKKVLFVSSYFHNLNVRRARFCNNPVSNMNNIAYWIVDNDTDGKLIETFGNSNFLTFVLFCLTAKRDIPIQLIKDIRVPRLLYTHTIQQTYDLTDEETKFIKNICTPLNDKIKN